VPEPQLFALRLSVWRAPQETPVIDPVENDQALLLVQEPFYREMS
jgi:hypothetical protein